MNNLSLGLLVSICVCAFTIGVVITALSIMVHMNKKRSFDKLKASAYPKWIIHPSFNIADCYDVYCVREQDFYNIETGRTSFMKFLGDGRFKEIYKNGTRPVMLISCGPSMMDNCGLSRAYIPKPYTTIWSEIDNCFIHGITFKYLTIQNTTDYHSSEYLTTREGFIVAYNTLIKPSDMVVHWLDFCTNHNIHFLMPNEPDKQ